jgi:hypothetical protein
LRPHFRIFRLQIRYTLSVGAIRRTHLTCPLAPRAAARPRSSSRVVIEACTVPSGELCIYHSTTDNIPPDNVYIILSDSSRKLYTQKYSPVDPDRDLSQIYSCIDVDLNLDLYQSEKYSNTGGFARRGHS